MLRVYCNGTLGITAIIHKGLILTPLPPLPIGYTTTSFHMPTGSTMEWKKGTCTHSPVERESHLKICILYIISLAREEYIHHAWRPFYKFPHKIYIHLENIDGHHVAALPHRIFCIRSYVLVHCARVFQLIPSHSGLSGAIQQPYWKSSR